MRQTIHEWIGGKGSVACIEEREKRYASRVGYVEIERGVGKHIMKCAGSEDRVMWK